jgi:hypothetical protein
MFVFVISKSNSFCRFGQMKCSYSHLLFRAILHTHHVNGVSLLSCCRQEVINNSNLSGKYGRRPYPSCEGYFRAVIIGIVVQLCTSVASSASFRTCAILMRLV